MMIELGKYTFFIEAGIIYGIVTGIFAGLYFCANLLVKKNVASDEKKDIPKYTSRGFEVFNRNMTDEFAPVVANGKKSSVFEDEYEEDNLDYFQRNMDLDYVPPKREKPEINKVSKRPVNRRPVNRNRYAGNIRTHSINEGVAAASASAAKVAADLKESEKESLSE